MRRLGEEECVAVLEALLEQVRNARVGDRRESPAYLALKQTISDMKARTPRRAIEAAMQLGRAIEGLDRIKEETGGFGPSNLQDVAMKARAYFPLIREALLKWGFACAAQSGAAPVSKCSWPTCVCDPYAQMVLNKLAKAGLLDDGIVERKESGV